jgi:integrator complex subunit 4
MIDVAILILVFNAAKDCVTMFDLFEKHTIRHYFYLRDTYPLLVPHLLILDTDVNKICSNNSFDTNSENSSSHLFLLSIFERVRNIMCLKSATVEVQTSILNHSIR